MGLEAGIFFEVVNTYVARALATKNNNDMIASGPGNVRHDQSSGAGGYNDFGEMPGFAAGPIEHRPQINPNVIKGDIVAIAKTEFQRLMEGGDPAYKADPASAMTVAFDRAIYEAMQKIPENNREESEIWAATNKVLEGLLADAREQNIDIFLEVNPSPVRNELNE